MFLDSMIPLTLAAGLAALALALLPVVRRRNIPFAAIDAAGMLMVIVDHSFRVARCTHACSQITGLAHAQMIGRDFADLFANSAQIEKLSSVMRESLSSRRSLVVDCELRAANGERRWLAWNITPGPRSLFGGSSLICQATDVTVQKQYDHQNRALELFNHQLHSNGGETDMLQVLVEHAAEYLQADAVALLLVKPAANELVLEKYAGHEPGTIDGWRIPLKDGLFREAIGTRQPMVLPAAEPDLHLLPPPFAKAGSVVLIPISSEDGRARGMLLAAGRDCCPVGPLQTLVSIALIASNVLHRYTLEEANRRRLKRLTALYTINIAVSASLDIHDIFHVLVDQVTSQLGVDAADIFVVDGDTRDLALIAGSGFRAGLLQKMHLWMGQGRAGQVALNRKSTQLYDPAGIAPLFLPDRQLAGEDFVSYEAVPLVQKGEVRGVLETFHRAPYQRDPEWVEFLESLAAEMNVAIANAEMMDLLQRSNRDLQLAYEATLEGWALALDMRDHETEGHTRRVTDLTTRLAQSMGIRGDDLKYIRYGALLHDIGKIAIPDGILNKPGPLTSEEKEIMRQHPENSRQMLASIPFLAPATAIPCFHHERWDGTGYPNGFVGTQIPFPARIFAVVDVWDAMCSRRVYRAALPEAMVLDYIQQEAGRQFDPDVVKAFVNLIEWVRGHPGG